MAPWKLSYTLNVPNTWRGGLYVATFETEDKYRSCVPFVVREDGKAADLLVVLPFTTYQAYNMYPVDKKFGSSLYNAYLPDGKEGGADICSTRVSFDRPYHQDGLPRLFELDQAFAQWVEAQPYTISYASSIDLHAGRVDPTKYKALVFSGHDEYWSPQMRTVLQGALTRGVSAAFMAANNVYWNIRLDASEGGVPAPAGDLLQAAPGPGGDGRRGADGAVAGPEPARAADAGGDVHRDHHGRRAAAAGRGRRRRTGSGRGPRSRTGTRSRTWWPGRPTRCSRT